MNPRHLFRGSFAIALVELRCIRRGVKTWLLALLALAAGGAAFVFFHHAALQHHSVGHYSGNIVPGRFLMAGYAACFLLPLLAGVVFLAFDHRQRDGAARIVETLEARPVSNVAFFVGRLMALVAAMWLLCAVFVVLMQAAGLAADKWLRSGAVDGWLGPLEPWSLAAFLFVDALPALIFWGALVLFLAATLRNRLAVAAVGVALLAGYGWLLLQAPLRLLPAISILSGFESFASDMLPRFLTIETAMQRGALLLLAAGLVVLGARWNPRADNPSRLVPIASGLALVAAGAGAIALLAQAAFATEARRSAWLQAHSAYQQVPAPDILRLSVDVAIDPGKALRVDASLDLAVPTVPLPELVFSLNPGMRVEVLELNGHALPYQHESGLLRIAAGDALAGTEATLRVVASGLPDASFAYLDAIVDPLALGVADGHFRILGTEPMVFSDDYAVLLPGLKWQPLPGPNLTQATPDFHDLDMQLNVPAGWRAVASGDRESDSPNGDRQIFRFRSTTAVPVVGVIAGRFDRYATEVNGVEMELLLHPGHQRNAKFFAEDATRLLSVRLFGLTQARMVGLGYPHPRFSVVEVPGRLRGFGGGWQLDTTLALPGVALLREYGLPSMRMTMPPVHMVLFFMPEDFTGGDPTIALWRTMTRFRTAATGTQATLVNFLMDEMAKSIAFAYWPSFFSAHHFNARSSEGIMAQTLERMMGHGTAVDHEVMGVAERVATSHEFLTNQLAEMRFEDDPQGALEMLNFKGRMLADSLSHGWPGNGAAKLLGEVLRRHAGEAYTLEDLRVAAEAAGTPLDSVLGEWWKSAQLPGFVASPLQILRLKDEGQSPRYQLSLHVCNAEPVPGLVRLSCRGTDLVKQSPYSTPAPVPANACVEVGAITDFVPVQARLRTYLSRNGNGIALTVPDVDATRIVDVEPLRGVRDSAWRPPPSDDVVIDDLSPTFTLEDDTAPRGLRLLRRQLAWSRQETSGAWGRYARTAVVSEPGEGNRSATFAARLPRAGRWRLQYHLPEGTEISAYEGGGGMSLRQAVATHALGTYDMTLVEHTEDGDGGESEASYEHTRIEFDGSIAEQGWNHLGDFDLQSRDVSLVVTDRTDGEAVVADAIRWRPLGIADGEDLTTE